jgi:UPF0176 protein
MQNLSMTSAEPLLISAFYHFQALPEERLKDLAKDLTTLGESHGVRGLLILASEGLNGTAAGPAEALRAFLKAAAELLGFPELPTKETTSYEWPFRKFKVRLRKEIVSLGKPEVQPHPPKSNTHLSPDEWDQMMKREDAVVIDTRNTYETRVGKFRGAIDPGIEEFNSFTDFMRESGIEKDKKILIYCTGGIRCEKATVDLERLGYKEVYQLDGGILNYFMKRAEPEAAGACDATERQSAATPASTFEGECFVFDTRVAVDQKLNPTTKYKLCPHCGQPADVTITCVRCDTEAVICPECAPVESKQTCSKNCAHHWEAQPGKKGRNQGENYRGRPTGRRKKHA